MAPSKKSSSSSLTQKVHNTRGKAVADKAATRNAKETLTTGQTKKSEKMNTKWLGKDNDGTNLVTTNSPKKGQATTDQAATAVKKTQQKLSGYFHTTKTITSAGEEEEEVRETKTKESVKEITYEPGREIIKEHQEIITDTTIITTKAADPDKKRKHVEDDDLEQSPDEPASMTVVMEAVDAGNENGSTDQLPRRQAAKAINVSSLCPFAHHFANPFQSYSDIDNSGLANNSEGADRFTDLEDISDSSPKSLIITLSLPTVKKPVVPAKKRRVRVKPASGWDNPDYYFKFGWTPFSEHLSPTHPMAFNVYEILQIDLASRGITVGPGERGVNEGGPEGPAHGTLSATTVDAIVRTILAQATNNDNALYVQELLKKKFTYLVDGQEVQGTMPNYHTMHNYPQADLAIVIQPGGIHNMRAKFIKSLLAVVYKANTSANPAWDGVHHGNEANAADFVPGLLSLSFLDGKSKVEMLNWLLSLDGVGIKTAHCIMEFNYGFPLCAVDTHVLFMAAALGWLPDSCTNPDTAAMHLDARLPEAIKHHLHQAFWNHRQHCGPCKRGAKPPKDETEVAPKDATEGSELAEECVLEEKMSRRIHRARMLKAGEPKERKVVVKKVIKKEAATVRKTSMRPLAMFTAEQAAEAGYEYAEMTIDDDFAAGSVNKKVKKFWALKSE